MYDPEWEDLVLEFYPDILGAMLTLVQFVVLDSIRESYIPLVHRDPIVIPYFLGFMLVVSIAMMNLVTAVIVEGSLEQAKKDHEAQRLDHVSSLLPRLREVFNEVDADKSGSISMDEVEEADANTRKELMKLVHVDNLQEVFDMLDTEGSGEVDIDEFLEGIVRVVTTTEPVGFIRILKQLRISRDEVAELHFQIIELERSLATIQESKGIDGDLRSAKPGSSLLDELRAMNRVTNDNIAKLAKEVMDLRRLDHAFHKDLAGSDSKASAPHLAVSLVRKAGATMARANNVVKGTIVGRDRHSPMRHSPEERGAKRGEYFRRSKQQTEEDSAGGTQGPRARLDRPLEPPPGVVQNTWEQVESSSTIEKKREVQHREPPGECVDGCLPPSANECPIDIDDESLALHEKLRKTADDADTDLEDSVVVAVEGPAEALR